VLKGILDGRVIRLLGAGVDLCGRPPGVEWTRGLARYLPSRTELAAYLAWGFGYPDPANGDLACVSQCVRTMAGSGPLYGAFRSLVNADFPPNALHGFLARLPAAFRARRYSAPHQLIVTTNHDDVVERAFGRAGEPYAGGCVVAEGSHGASFLHRSPDGDVRVIERPNEYRGFSLDDRRNLPRPDRRAGVAQIGSRNHDSSNP
jgi:hypothetical protein